MTTGDRLRVLAEDDEVLTAEELRRVRAVLILCGVGAAELDDAHQDVQVRLIEHLRRREPIRNRPAWLAVVASRIAMDFHRSRARTDGLRGRVAAKVQDHVAVRDRDLGIAVAQVLDQLPFDQRTILVLRFYSDMTVPQMAEFMEIPVGTVKSRLHAATQAAGSILRAQGIGSEES